MEKIFLLLFMIFLTFSCVIVKELIPQKPTTSLMPEDIVSFPKDKLQPEDSIGFEYFYIKGYNEPHSPPIVEPTNKLKEFLLQTHGSYDLNRSGIIRYYNKKNSNNKLNRIIILVPGIYSGGATVANLGKSIVRRLNDSEVWIWERRANMLEDRRSNIEALEKKDPSILLKLLKEKDKFVLKKDAFYQPSTEDISFLGYWGINVMLNDLYNVVIEAKSKANEVVLAGYSLGVLYTTIFLSNEFTINNKLIPGYSLVNKTILFDGPPVIDAYVKTEKTYKEGTTLIPYNVIEGIDKLESGKYYPCSGTANRDMSMFFLMDLKNTLAFLDPNGISIEPYEIGLSKIPITNLAKDLIQIDDNYQSFKLFTASLGHADAMHIGKFDSQSTVFIIGLSKNKKFIDWIPRDTDDKTELNNYKEYLKTACSPDFNLAEWYQPTRILLDFGAISNNDTSTGWQAKYFNVTQSKNINIPFLCVGLARGLSQKIDIYKNYKLKINSKDYTVVMINNYTHLDGDTITDNGERPILADVTYHWLNKEDIAYKTAKNYNEALLIQKTK